MIADFRFLNPVLVNGAGVLVVSHDRVMTAKRLADNQIMLNSSCDEALLAVEIAQ